MLTAEQVAARKVGIGASESVILFSSIPNSYSTPYKLWMQKTGRIESDYEDDDFQWWGHELEPVIAKRYEFETGEKLEYYSETCIHPNFPFMLCHPDRFVMGKRKLLEIKTASYSPDKWGEPGTDQIPPEYLIQVQHQMAVTGYDECDLIVFFMNFRESRIYHIKRNDILIATIEKAVSEFWNKHVWADIAPPLTALSDFRSRFSLDNGKWLDATPHILTVLSVLKDARSKKNAYIELENESLKEIFGFIGFASGIKHEGKVLGTWKANKNGVRSFKLKENQL